MAENILAEKWVPVLGYEGRYEVSNLGRVKSISPTRGKFFSLKPCKDGYVNIYLSSKSKKTYFGVHRIVMRSFRGPAPDGLEVNHKDGNRSNNRLENLEYTTHRENILHAIRTGLYPATHWIGEGNPRAKLNWDSVRQIRKSKDRTIVLAKKYGVHRTTIQMIRINRLWQSRTALTTDAEGSKA